MASGKRVLLICSSLLVLGFSIYLKVEFAKKTEKLIEDIAFREAKKLTSFLKVSRENYADVFLGTIVGLTVGPDTAPQHDNMDLFHKFAEPMKVYHYLDVDNSRIRYIATNDILYDGNEDFTEFEHKMKKYFTHIDTAEFVLEIDHEAKELKFALPDKLSKPNFVSFLNKNFLIDSDGWKIGDALGVIVFTQPLDQFKEMNMAQDDSNMLLNILMILSGITFLFCFLLTGKKS